MDKIDPLVEYMAFFWDPWQSILTEMIQYRVVRYIFNDFNLCKNRQADESQSDTTMTNIFARPIKMPDS